MFQSLTFQRKKGKNIRAKKNVLLNSKSKLLY